MTEEPANKERLKIYNIRTAVLLLVSILFVGLTVLSLVVSFISPLMLICGAVDAIAAIVCFVLVLYYLLKVLEYRKKVG